MTLHQLAPLFALALNILLLGSALMSDRKNQRAYVFAAVTAALSVWNLGVFGLRTTTDPVVALAWERVLHVGVIAIPILFYHYVLAVLDLSRRRRTLVVGYGLAALFVLAIPTPWFMPGVLDTYWGFSPKSGPLYAPFFVYFQTYLVLGLVQLLRSHRTVATSFRRNRIRLVIFGACVSLAGGAVDFLRFIVGWERLYPVGIPASTVFAVALGVAIVRYRLWDVGILAKRVLLYALSTLALVPVVVACFHAFDFMTAEDHSSRLVPLALLVVGVIATVLPFMRWLEQRFGALMFARQTGVHDALVALSKDMASVVDMERLGRTLTDGVVQRVPLLHAGLYLKERGDEFLCFAHAAADALETAAPAPRLDDRIVLLARLTRRPVAVEELATGAFAHPALTAALEAARVAVLVPLALDDDLAAVLLVGEKVSGEVFSADELGLLEMLVGQTAIALKNARLYDDLRRQMAELQSTQQQLIQSAKLAAIGELAAGVAHELNNPLTVILGKTGLLLRETKAGTTSEAKLSDIEREAMRAGKIAQNLLDFARRREPKHEPLDLNRLVERVLDLLQAKLRGRPIQVETVLDPRLGAMLGDADQLTQVLINLAGNAIDAMPSGGRLTIATRAQADSDTGVLVVSDTGLGMAPEQLARIFEPFYTTKPEGSGTGLGLSITQGIIASHRGELTVDSAVGQGTTFTVRLPLASVPEPVRRVTVAAV
jgi:signal transduction histidine kinase